jgi:hypothetical protein
MDGERGKGPKQRGERADEVREEGRKERTFEIRKWDKHKFHIKYISQDRSYRLFFPHVTTQRIGDFSSFP